MKSYQETVGLLKVTDISVEGKEFENANKRWCSCWKKNSEEVGGDAASSKQKGLASEVGQVTPCPRQKSEEQKDEDPEGLRWSRGESRSLDSGAFNRRSGVLGKALEGAEGDLGAWLGKGSYEG